MCALSIELEPACMCLVIATPTKPAPPHYTIFRHGSLAESGVMHVAECPYMGMHLPGVLDMTVIACECKLAQHPSSTLERDHGQKVGQANSGKGTPATFSSIMKDQTKAKNYFKMHNYGCLFLINF